MGHSAFPVRCRYLQFGPAFCEDQRICGDFLRLAMQHQLKPLRQKRLQHTPDLVPRRVGALRLSGDIELVGIGPSWAAQNADTLNRIGQANRSEEHTSELRSPMRLLAGLLL